MNPQEYSFGILRAVFPPLCLLAAFSGALPALCSLWSSLCWSPYSRLNHFPSHYCNSLLAASVNLCCTDSQGCCLLPLPRSRFMCPQFLAGPWIALLAIPFAIRLALSLAFSDATFFFLHILACWLPASASFWLIGSIFWLFFFIH